MTSFKQYYASVEALNRELNRLWLKTDRTEAETARMKTLDLIKRTIEQK